MVIKNSPRLTSKFNMYSVHSASENDIKHFVGFDQCWLKNFRKISEKFDSIVAQTLGIHRSTLLHSISEFLPDNEFYTILLHSLIPSLFTNQPKM